MKEKTGFVHLVGAGCGRADLITVRGLNLLRCCEVVIYDDLIDTALLDMAPEGAERIYVGKREGRPSANQEWICHLLVEKANEGKRVVRLKGGDPFVFGRGGEEMLALMAAGVPCDEVPGISSAIAIPASAGIPVTHRGVSTSLHIVTGHTIHTEDGLPGDLNRLAGMHGTLVFLMGLKDIERLTGGLMEAGMAPETPAAVVSGGCAPCPAVVRADLREIAQRCKSAGVQAPAVIVVGGVAQMNLRAQVQLPLEGKRVGLTGTPSMAEKLHLLLEEAGAQVQIVSESTVQTLPLNNELENLCDGDPHWLVFTSANGVRVFYREVLRRGLDLRRFHACKFAVIGAATGAALREGGIQPDLCPENVYTSEALGEELCAAVKPGEDVVLLRSALATRILPETLAKGGITPRELSLYTVQGNARMQPPALEDLDYLVFSSAGGVEVFLKQYGRIPKKCICACIGTTAAQPLGNQSKERVLIAKRASAEALVAEICLHAAQK